jgi:hypothetical protein
MSDHNASQQAFSGPVPKFFQSAPDAPEMVERLWYFANGIYLGNPMPSLFKERLCVYLSRFCGGRYCITRHSGFLLGLGQPSGDPSAQVETVAQVIRLLKTPTPWQRDMNAVLLRLKPYRVPSIGLSRKPILKIACSRRRPLYLSSRRVANGSGLHCAMLWTALRAPYGPTYVYACLPLLDHASPRSGARRRCPSDARSAGGN